jgi:hypothetical protein
MFAYGDGTEQLGVWETDAKEGTLNFSIPTIVEGCGSNLSPFIAAGGSEVSVTTARRHVEEAYALTLFVVRRNKPTFRTRNRVEDSPLQVPNHQKP